MNDNPLIQETEKDPAIRRKESLDYLARCQKDLASNYVLSDTPVEQLDTTVRAYSALKRAGVNKVSDILTADFSAVPGRLSIKFIDEIMEYIYSEAKPKKSKRETT